MSEILFQYERISPTTWVYVSSLMTIGLFFKFGRLWSVRNLDLLLLVALSPGLLMVVQGQKIQRTPPKEITAEEALPRDGTPESPLPDDEAAPDDEAPEAFLSVAPDEPAPRELAPREPAPRELAPRDPRLREPAKLDAQGAAPLNAEDDEDAPAAEGPSAQEPLLTEEDLEFEYEGDPADLIGSGPTQAGFSGGEEQLPEHVTKGRNVEARGYYWLFAVGVLLLARLLIDPNMVRRPLLEPNLTTGGMVFLGCALFVFLMANVITGPPSEDEPSEDYLYGPAAAQDLIARRDTSGDPNALAKHGPGLRLLYTLPTISTSALVDPPEDWPEIRQERFAQIVTAKTMAILSHLAIVLGMVVIGYRHFDNLKMGVGAAALYLLMPYTAEMTGRVDHALPGALLIWAVATYRRPLVAGMFFGLAAGVIYYPLFLLPLWGSFYWQRGLARFAGGVLAMLALMTLSLVFTSADFASFWLQFKAMFGIHPPAMEGLHGIWRVAWDPAYRVPILAAFIALSGTMALWPPRKNFGTLLSCSGAIMLAAQFWTGYFGGGGTIMAWYLPLLLLTVFRPNLEDRVAVAVLDKGRWPRLAPLSQAA